MNIPVKIFHPVCLLLFLFSVPLTLNARDASPELNIVSEVIHYTYPRICPKSDQFKVKVNNEEAFVYYTRAGNFAAFESDEVVKIQIELLQKTNNIKVLPGKLGIEPVLENNLITFGSDIMHLSPFGP